MEISSCTAEQVDSHNACQEHPANTGSRTSDIELSVKIHTVQSKSNGVYVGYVAQEYC